MDFSTMLLAMGAGLAGSLAGGSYAVFLVRRLRQTMMPIDNSAQILRNAALRKEAALNAALQATQEHLAEEVKRCEEERQVVQRIQEAFEQELNQKQSELDKKDNELSQIESKQSARHQVIQTKLSDVLCLQNMKQQVQQEYELHLENKAAIKRDDLAHSLRIELLDAERLALSKWVLEHTEEFKSLSQKLGKDVLNVIVSRYSPKFIWPKTTFTIDTPSKAMAEQHFGPTSKLLTALTEGLDINVDLISDGEEPPTIKLSGGSGVEKESLRLTLEEVIAKSSYSVEKALQIQERCRKQLERLILKQGEDAAKILGLQGLHPEILKLIGSLNFRTSHRQNQYWHSLEVARLAGMLADELGLDAQLAKRAGLLHDIGKALDYKIEGSHAVISAEYAAQHGESAEVVDTVLSHHDDKIVETPYAYILKAADAMSGARPGARVEMEEGYQKRLEAISDVIKSFENSGVTGSAIMHAGREVHVFVDNRKVKERDTEPLACNIVKKLEENVEFPGQIRVTVVRRTEVTEVA